MPRYSPELREVAAKHPREVRSLERAMIELILAGSSSRDIDGVHPALAALAQDLAAHYGLVTMAAEDEYSDNVRITLFVAHATRPAIPRCSLSRAAENERAPEAAASGGKFKRSMLKIDRKPAPGSAPQAALVAPLAEIPDGDLVVGVRSKRRAAASGSFGALQLDEADDASDSFTVPLPDDLCCICLDPLLLSSRARAGESLALLDCRHVLHSACAHDCRVAKLRTPGGTLAMTVGPRGSSVPDLGKLRCPICRVESHGLTELPLVVRRKAQGAAQGAAQGKSQGAAQGAARGAAPLPAQRAAAAASQPAKGSPRKKAAEAGSAAFDPVVLELMGMGFEYAEAAAALHSAAGNAQRAVDMLLGLVPFDRTALVLLP